MPTNRRVLISGAGVAGSALAYWLTKSGYSVTIIEYAPALRTGGYTVDIRGAAVKVIDRMGILGQVKKAGLETDGMVFVNERGESITNANQAAIGSKQGVDIEIMRDDLCKIIHNRNQGMVTYLWDDSITSITQDDNGVHVGFKQAAAQSFDILIGADGLHSNVRKIVFGDEVQFSRNLGCYISIFTVPNYLNLSKRQLMYTVPGKTAGVYSAEKGKTLRAFFLFASAPLHYDRYDSAQQKRLVRHALIQEKGWEIQRLLAHMEQTPDFYFDAITQIRMETWSKGRIALVGDAAYGPSPASGQGTSLALVGAYVLANELAEADGNYTKAFAAYQQKLQAFVLKNQKIGLMSAKSLIEDSNVSIWIRNRLLRLPFIMRLLYKQVGQMIEKAADAIEL